MSMNMTNAGAAIQNTRSYEATIISTTRITPDSSEEEIREIVFDVHRKDAPYQVGHCIGVWYRDPKNLAERTIFGCIALPRFLNEIK